MNNIISRFIVLSFYFTLCTNLWSQSNQMAEINKIKKDPSYLYVTGTSMKSEEESSQNAQIMLASEIEGWLKENAKGDLTGYTAKAKQCIGFIQTKIGSLHRTFAYVKKTDILPYYNDEVIISNTPKEVTIINNSTSGKKDSDSEKQRFSDKQGTDNNNIAPENTEKKNKKAEININNKKDVTVSTYTPKDNNTEKGLDTEVKSVIKESRGIEANVTEENNIIKLNTANKVKSYIENHIKEKRIESYGKMSDYPQNGVTYFILSDYHGIVRKYIRSTNGISVDLETGSTIDLPELINKYSEKYSIWFTFK